MIDRARLRESLYCANEVIAERRRRGQPIPGWLREHHAGLATEWLMSESGHESDCGERPLAKDELIPVSEAAEILGISERQARRLSADLDGRIVGGRWVFSKSAVIEYGKERSAEHPRRS